MILRGVNNMGQVEQIQIKQLTNSDIEKWQNQFSGLLLETYMSSFKSEDVEEEFISSKVEDLKGYIEQEKAIVFGAFRSELIGFIWCYPRAFVGGERLHINQFVVDSSYRDSGIGSRLLKTVEKYACEKNIRTIDLMVSVNSPSAYYYEHKGFAKESYQMTKRMC